jgi:hypothetical protein
MLTPHQRVYHMAQTLFEVTKLLVPSASKCSPRAADGSLNHLMYHHGDLTVNIFSSKNNLRVGFYENE